MKELSLHILDIAQNSVKAGARLIGIAVEEGDVFVTVTVSDDGCGMNADMLARVADPYTTTRTTRKVGLGIPLFKLAAEQAGGALTIGSEPGRGTTLTASFRIYSVDRPPLGDMPGTMMTLVQGSPDIDFLYRHTTPGGAAELDTRVLREALDGVPLCEPEVLAFIEGSLREEEAALVSL